MRKYHTRCENVIFRFVVVPLCAVDGGGVRPDGELIRGAGAGTLFTPGGGGRPGGDISEKTSREC